MLVSTLKPGEVLLVDPSLPFKNGQYYLIKPTDLYPFVRRVEKKGDMYTLVPEKTDEWTITFYEEDIEYLHRIRLVELR